MQITVVAFVVFVVALRLSSAGLIYFQYGVCLLGSYAALTLTALGGAALPPAILVVPFVLLRGTRQKGGAAEVFRGVSIPAAWLLALAAWGIISAYICPRIFLGDAEVMQPMRGLGRIVQVPLAPSSGNLTQPAYAVGNALLFLGFRNLLHSESRVCCAGKATVFLTGLMVLSGLLNILEYNVGGLDLLEHTRTIQGANSMYAAEGFVRIQGTFSEASAFAARLTPLFAYCLELWMRQQAGNNAKLAGPLAATSFGLLIVATSGTGYASLCVYLPIAGLRLLPALVRYRRWPRSLAILVGIFFGLVIFSTIAWTLELGFTQDLNALFERTFFSKLDSASGKERSHWNHVALTAFFDTYGLGAGLGSTYASSLPVVVLSNLGLPGMLLLAGALKSISKVDLTSINSRVSPYIMASRQAVLATLITSSFSGTTFNLGVQFYLYAALASIDPRYLRR